MAWIFTENDCKSVTVDVMRITKGKCCSMLGARVSGCGWWKDIWKISKMSYYMTFFGDILKKRQKSWFCFDKFKKFCQKFAKLADSFFLTFVYCGEDLFGTKRTFIYNKNNFHWSFAWFCETFNIFIPLIPKPSSIKFIILISFVHKTVPNLI